MTSLLDEKVTSLVSDDLKTILKKPCVLAVDDLSSNLVALEASLKSDRFDVVCADSGEKALKLASQMDFAVILLDVQMPGMNGFEAAQKIRGIHRAVHTPIIFLTAIHPTNEFVLKGYDVGCVDYIFKPLNIEILRAKISVFVDLFCSKQEIERQGRLLLKIEKQVKERELEWIKKSSERKYQILVEGIKEGIVWAADAHSLDLTFVSPHAEKISGFPSKRWLTEKDFLRAHLHPNDRDNVIRVLTSAWKQPDISHGVEHRFMKPDGTVMWFYTEVCCPPMRDRSNGELYGLSFNITHLKETERALRDAVRVRDEFLSIASHELRTPITPLQLQMQGFLFMLEQGQFENMPVDELRRMLEVSNTQVTRLSRLVSQILDISRLNAGRLALEPGRFDLSSLVRDILEQLRYEITISDCSLKADIEDGVVGEWDKLRLEQVIVNLLSNSLKYGAGKPIEIRLRSVEGAAVIEIKDNGIGIDAKDQERIFGQFERAVSAKHFGGLGLGLFITHQIVQLHGGKITVESAPGKGAKFVVELPLCRSQITHIAARGENAVAELEVTNLIEIGSKL